MSINLGLDFGTTYTMASYLKYTGEPDICEIAGGEKVVDSIAVLDNRKGKIFFGRNAISHIREKNKLAYRGFKMLIGGGDDSLKEKCGYTDEVSPEALTSNFLEYVLKEAKKKYSADNKIDKLVVGVPAIWSENIETVDRSTVLTDIIRENKEIDISNIEVVTEPVAACAYCAYQFKKKENKNFVGKMVVIDYGGGTLDITLCDVTENGINSSIRDLKTIGQGWNTDRRIGKAGLSFMEEVTKIAFQGKCDDIENHPELVKDVEQFIINHSSDIETVFRTYGQGDKDLKTVNKDISAGDYIPYNDDEDDDDEDDDEVRITCSMLAEAYETVIEKNLKDELEEIKEICAKDYQIDIMKDSPQDDVKIILVGGFNRFYLTRRQIMRFFNALNTTNKRFDIFLSEEERERAIAYGTALIANGVIGFERSMPYHLGVGIGKPKTQESEGYLTEAFYAIHKGEKLIWNKEYFIEYPNGEPMFFSASAIPLLVKNLNDDVSVRNSQLKFGLEKEFEKSVDLSKTNEQPCKIAFSLDKSMVITVHIYVAKDDEHLEEIVDKFKIKLSKIDELVGKMHVIRRK